MVLNVSSSTEGVLFLEAIQKQIRMVDIIADYFPGKVAIKFEGEKDKLKDALEIAKNIHLIIRGMLKQNVKGFFSYDIGFFSKMSGKTVPIKTLMRVLELKSYETYKESEILYSKINYKDLIAIIQIIDRTQNKIPYEVATSSLRDVIVILVIINGITTEEAINKLKRGKLVSEDEYKRLNLVVEPEQAIKKCLKIT